MCEERLSVVVDYKDRRRDYGNGEIERTFTTVRNYQGQLLDGFLCPDIYASLHTWYLRKEALLALIEAQQDLNAGGYSLLIVDAWRSYETQERAHARKPHLAVSPEQSKHTKGLAVDLRLFDVEIGAFDQAKESTYGDQDYLAEILESYGFKRTVMPKEPWHFDFKGPLDGG